MEAATGGAPDVISEMYVRSVPFRPGGHTCPARGGGGDLGLPRLRPCARVRLGVGVGHLGPLVPTGPLPACRGPEEPHDPCHGPEHPRGQPLQGRPAPLAPHAGQCGGRAASRRRRRAQRGHQPAGQPARHAPRGAQAGAAHCGGGRGRHPALQQAVPPLPGHVQVRGGMGAGAKGAGRRGGAWCTACEAAGRGMWAACSRCATWNRGARVVPCTCCHPVHALPPGGTGARCRVYAVAAPTAPCRPRAPGAGPAAPCPAAAPRASSCRRPARSRRGSCAPPPRRRARAR